MHNKSNFLSYLRLLSRGWRGLWNCKNALHKR